MIAASNTPAVLFHHLVTTWHHDVTSDRVDQLAADLAAHTAAGGGLALVGLVRSDAVRRLFNLACYLNTYGLTLRQRYIRDRSYAFVYAEIEQPQPSPYVGAVVIERRQELAA